MTADSILGAEMGVFCRLFAKAKNKIQDPASQPNGLHNHACRKPL